MAGYYLLCISKCFYMEEQNQEQSRLQDVKDIRRLMERSSRFTTLSGLSCLAAGVAALLGAWQAYRYIQNYYGPNPSEWHYTNVAFVQLRDQLLLLAFTVFGVALVTAFYFTWSKSKKQGISLWGHSSRRVFWNMAVPLGAGGLFILGMVWQNEWRFVASACLLFYGLALVNAGKYTLADIRYMGYCEIVLGLLNLFLIPYSVVYWLYFWAVGFGVIHIIYGLLMWYKYDRKSAD